MSDNIPGDTVGLGATRERVLAETFVGLADTLVDDYDVVDLLDGLVSSCVSIFGITAAGLLLVDQRGHLSVVATSSEQTRMLEIFQLQTDQGPCLDCVRGAQTVTSGDLEADRGRWPDFVPAALAVGFRSVAAVPMRLRDDTIGGLNLFDSRPILMAEEDRRIAQALADVATIGILQQRSQHRSAMLAEQLQQALNSRIIIEQAKGVVAERSGVGMDVAFETLRTYARNHNRKLSEVALEIVHGQLDPRSG
jgi:GAF domain-containing protein